MSAPTYMEQIAAVAADITKAAAALKGLTDARRTWSEPQSMRLNMGHDYVFLVRSNGTVFPGLEGLQREALGYIDARIAEKQAQIEGLRFKLVKIGREGGAA